MKVGFFIAMITREQLAAAPSLRAGFSSVFTRFLGYRVHDSANPATWLARRSRLGYGFRDPEGGV